MKGSKLSLCCEINVYAANVYYTMYNIYAMYNILYYKTKLCLKIYHIIRDFGQSANIFMAMTAVL